MVNLFPHPASFGFHLAMDTLAFGYILPTTGRIRVFHPLETCAARRTILKQAGVIKGAGLFHIQNDIVWNQVKRVDSINTKDTVYNIEVENDNSYTVNNCIVHNLSVK